MQRPWWRVAIGTLLIVVGVALVTVDVATLRHSAFLRGDAQLFGGFGVILAAWGASIWTSTAANWRGRPYMLTFSGGYVGVGVLSLLITGDPLWFLLIGLGALFLTLGFVRVWRGRVSSHNSAAEK